MGIDTITCYCRANKSASLTAKSEAHIATDLDKKKPFLGPTNYLLHSFPPSTYHSLSIPIGISANSILFRRYHFPKHQFPPLRHLLYFLSQLDYQYFFRRTTIYPHYFCSPLFAKANLDPKFSVKIACIHSVTISPSRHRHKITYKT